MTTIKELKAWLDQHGEDHRIGVDEGGLTLIIPDSGAEFEIGGIPEEDENPEEEEDDCQHLTGYWINQPDHFRCYKCGYQILLRYLSPKSQALARDIQVWHRK